jgi:hypothetical protein
MRINRVAAASLVVLLSCNLDPIPLPEGPTGFCVEFVDGQDLGEASPLPFMESGGVDIDIVVSPVGGDFDGWVTVQSRPGQVTRVSGVETRGNLARLTLAQGEEVTLTVTITLALSFTNIWIMDDGMAPSASSPAACSDGLDNDGDGLVDEMQDPGCASADDGSEEGGGGIVGVSGDIRFANPRIADVQGSSNESPLVGSAVTIDQGTMVVTTITTDGFHVTDISADAPADGSNSLFVFNYNTPWYLRECDVVTDLSGIVSEFYGLTELSFPSWVVVDPDGRVAEPTSSAECPIPAPVELTPALVTDFWDMENLESGLVRITGGRIGDTFMDCDLDGDGIVSFDGTEATCADSCAMDGECTEINTYMSYGQYAVVLDGCRGSGCDKVWAVTRHVVPDFWADHHSDEVIPAITGTLRHIYFLDPEWIIELRCSDDLVLEGSPLPMWEACVPQYAHGEYFDNN